MRPAHALKENARSEQWRNLVFLDTETTSKTNSQGVTTHTFRLACTRWHQVGRKTDHYEEFYSEKELWKYIDSLCVPKRKIVLFAHHLYFDLKVSRGHVLLPKMGWTAWRYFFAENGPSCFICLRKGTRSLWLIDSLNFFTAPLSDLAPLVGRAKQEVNFDNVTDSELMARCRSDVDILADLMIEYLDMVHREDLGNPGKTLAAQAFNLFRHRYMRHRIFLHNNESAYKLEVASYKGARTECFRVGSFTGDFYLLDIRSHYPSMMRTGTFPVRLLRYQERQLSIPYLDHLTKRYFCIADVTLQSEESYYPFTTSGNHPLHYADGDTDPLCNIDQPGMRTAFPRGRFRTVLCGETLRRAVEQGVITELHRLALYEAQPIFTDFVNDLWRRRKAALAAENRIYAHVWKKLMNSLYGKFGQRVRDKLLDYPCSPDDFSIGHVYEDNKQLVEWRFMGTATRFSWERHCGQSSFIAVAAAVTDRGRNLLWAIMMEAGEAHVYYCDTDGIVVDTEGYNNLLHRLGEDLGQLSLKERGSHLVINASKDFSLGDHIARKGIRPNAIFDPATGKYRQERWEHIRGALTRGDKEGYRISQEVRAGATDVWGRHVLPDGSTIPVMIGLH